MDGVIALFMLLSFAFSSFMACFAYEYGDAESFGWWVTGSGLSIVVFLTIVL